MYFTTTYRSLWCKHQSVEIRNIIAHETIAEISLTKPSPKSSSIHYVTRILQDIPFARLVLSLPCHAGSFHIPPFLFPSTTFSILLSVRYAACALYHQRTARNNHHLNGHHLLQPVVLQLTEISILDCRDRWQYVRVLCRSRSERHSHLCSAEHYAGMNNGMADKCAGVLVFCVWNKPPAKMDKFEL